MSDIDFEREFLKGQRDCRDGRPHAGGTDAYCRGYSAQYESDQVDTWRLQQPERLHGH